MSPRRRPDRPLYAVLVVAVAALLGGCTGVPTSSTPQVIESVARPSQTPEPAPLPYANTMSIVSGFLAANASGDKRPARLYLTPEEKNKWSDSSGTTILGSLDLEPSDTPAGSDTVTVTVTGDLVGTISPSGVFTPNLQGSAPPQSQMVTLTKVKGQWRISGLTYNGLLISEAQFEQVYQPEFIYFFDQAGARMVPYLRYTSLTDSQLLAGWLMSQLASPPSASPTSTDLPSIPDASQVEVTVGGGLITVALPGASKLDVLTKYRMAAQVAYTLDAAAPGAPMRITDGNTPVVIPELKAATFYKSDFAQYEPPTINNPQLYYVYQGGVYDASGAALPGVLGNGSRNLTSVALARISPSPRVLSVAATSGTGSEMRLLLGQTGGSLHETAVTGALSRPAWAPGLDELWIGDGKTLYRVDGSGVTHAVPILPTSGTVSGTITAVRLSPDGSLVALVIAASGVAAQIWIGVVARTQNAVQVSGLTAISPADKIVEDVAWDGPCDLDAVGHDLKAPHKPSVYTVRCDGSRWTQPSEQGIGNLPQGGASSITVLPGASAAVAAGGAVWVQSGTTITGSAATWVGLSGKYTPGRNPVYAQ